MTATVPKLRTPGILAKEIGQPLHRIQYILRTRDHIRPAARAGQARLYDREAVAMIRHELNAIEARRAAGSSGDKYSHDDRYTEPGSTNSMG